MNIILNNNQETIERETLTINELLRWKNFTFKMLVVKINGKLVNKNDYDNARVHEGDDVVVLHLISGG